MKNKLTYLVLIVFAANLIGCSIPSNEVQVILLAGQSNMAGAGNYDELDDSIKARIKKVSNRNYGFIITLTFKNTLIQHIRLLNHAIVQW